MNSRTTNIPKAFALAFALAVGILVLLQVSRSAPAGAAPAAPTQGSSISLKSPRGTVLVSVLLKSNSLTANLPKEATDLLAMTKGSTAARLAAQRNPYKRSASESVAASIAEHARNAAIPMIRKAAAPDVSESEAVQRKIRRLGGRVISASPIPNQVVTRINASALPALERDPRVSALRSMRLPVSLASALDGSAAWWANGFTGQGPSLDGAGSPDVVVFDTGIRTTHNVFKTRLPGDCGTCLGSGTTRVISPVIRSDYSGSKHGNTIGAQIAGTAFTPSMNPAGQVGMAYGIDKLYDNYQATNPYLWDLGINVGGDTGLGGNTDLPEVINYSAGIYQDTVDLDPGWNYFDALESRFGILNTVSGGNCGIADPFYTNCGSGPHRIAAPGVNYNVLTMGGQDVTANPADTSTYAPWPNTSPGPTWGGRKKPDLIGPVNGTAGTPSAIDDTSTTSFGQGTSFAAPVAASGALLLSSAGVYLPTAQKAIMVNSARPVQGQTYWTPRTGWGAIDMDAAYYDRGNYANGTITGSGPNSARFYQVAGVANGDRATLVWNRRTDVDSLANPDNFEVLNPGYFNLTDLDLSQIDPSTLAVTSTGGSDAADTVDTAGGDPDPVLAAANATTDNPMPGNGTDGGDNIEQIRSTGTGTQILKVKSQSPVDGALSEPFSIAADNAPTALETPIPDVSLDIAPTIVGLNQSVLVTATVENTSADIDLENFSVELTAPSGTTITTGNNPSTPYSVGSGDTTTVSWIVENTSPGAKNFSATATATAYGETFSGSDSATLNVDATPPTVTLGTQPTWSTSPSPTFQWSGLDSQSAVDDFDVETAIDGSGFTPLLTATELTSTTATAAEGQKLRLRVRATDLFGNVSDWSYVETTIDAIPPVAFLGPVDKTKRGIRSASLNFSNLGSPVTAKFTFANKTGGRTGNATNGEIASYTNNSSKPDFVALKLVVTDALGRSATVQETYAIEPRLGPSGLKFKTIKRTRSGVTLGGIVSKEFTGKVTVTATRTGSKGTKRASKRVKAKKGKFSVSLRLKPGRYKFAASTPKTSVFAATSISDKLTFK